MITASVIADSLSPQGVRLVTMKWKYPRFIHSEVMTHRVFSRNAASSRAIPTTRMIDNVMLEPAMPLFWGANQPGMQAAKEVDAATKASCIAMWLEARDYLVQLVQRYQLMGLHKQIANRLLEPFFWMETLVSSTDWENFFALRAHKDAQPEFQQLAKVALFAMMQSKPRELVIGDWHLPFGDQHLVNLPTIEAKRKVCAARAARLSYQNFDGKINYEDDIRLADALIAAGHMSPFEHVACPMMDPNARSGNFRGWQQYRKSFPNENRAVDLEELCRRLSNEELQAVLPFVTEQ